MSRNEGNLVGFLFIGNVQGEVQVQKLRSDLKLLHHWLWRFGNINSVAFPFSNVH